MRTNVHSSFQLSEAILPKPLVFPPDTPLLDAIAAMSQAKFSACQLPDRTAPADGAHWTGFAQPDSCVIVGADAMTSPVLTRTIEQLGDITSTLRLMKENRIRHLPITDRSGRLRGLVASESAAAGAVHGRAAPAPAPRGDANRGGASNG